MNIVVVAVFFADDFHNKYTFALNFIHDILNLYLFLFIHHVILIVLLAQQLLYF